MRHGRERFIDLRFGARRHTSGSWATDCAAACRLSTCAGVIAEFGLTTNAIRPGFGITLRRRPKRFEPSSVVKTLAPVAFPPGRLRLATSPSWTGSSPAPKTMGIVVVAALTANAEGQSVAISSVAGQRTSSEASTFIARCTKFLRPFQSNCTRAESSD